MSIRRRIFVTVLAVMGLAMAMVILTARAVLLDDLYEEQERNARGLLILAMTDIQNRYRELTDFKLERVSDVRTKLKQDNRAVMGVLRAARSFSADSDQVSAQRQVLGFLRESTSIPGNVAVFNASLAGLLHWDQKVEGRKWTGIRDLRGNEAFESIRDSVLDKGRTYSVVLWPMVPGERMERHLLYAELFEPWGWFVCSIAPIGDIVREVDERKQEMVRELDRFYQHKLNTEDGYFFLFTGDDRLLIHPWLRESEAKQAVNRETGVLIRDELVRAAGGESGMAEYSFQVEKNRGRDVERVAFVRHFKPFDWYLVYSLSREGLEAPVHRLVRTQTVGIALAFLAASLLLFWLLDRLVRPLDRVSSSPAAFADSSFSSTDAGMSGFEDLSDRSDEVGGLVRTFLFMKERLVRHVEMLDQTNLENQRLAEELSQLTHDVIQAQESERQRIAAELHDDLAQDLSMFKIGYAAMISSGEVDPDRAARLTGVLDRAIASVRSLAYELKPPGLEIMGLGRTLERACEDMESASGMKVEFVSAGLEAVKLDYHQELTVFRIAQEALTNAAKHSGASQVAVRLTATPNSLIMRIQDNGSGFDAGDNGRVGKSHMGLWNIRERARSLGGALKVDSSPGKGTRISVEFPLDRDKPDK